MHDGLLKVDLFQDQLGILLALIRLVHLFVVIYFSNLNHLWFSF